MNSDRELMQQALEALTEAAECVKDDYLPDKQGHDWDDTITALSKRLAREGQEIDWHDMYLKEKRRSQMWIAKYEADIGPLEYAVPAAREEQEPVAWGMPSAGGSFIVDCITPEEHAREEGGYTVPLYTAPQPAVREVWCGCGDGIMPDSGAKCGNCVAADAAVREWQGLTEEEIELIETLKAPPVHPDYVDCDDWLDFARAIEQALRERNT